MTVRGILCLKVPLVNDDTPLPFDHSLACYSTKEHLLPGNAAFTVAEVDIQSPHHILSVINASHIDTYLGD